MFAGLIKTTGTVRSLTAPGEDGMLSVETPLLGELDIFDAVSVNGACLTVTGVRSDCQGFYADVSGETLARTTLGNLKAGDRVNLERALRMGDAVGGHLLLGHVDGMGRIAEQTSAFGSFILGIDFPRGSCKIRGGKGLHCHRWRKPHGKGPSREPLLCERHAAHRRRNDPGVTSGRGHGEHRNRHYRQVRGEFPRP